MTIAPPLLHVSARHLPLELREELDPMVRDRIDITLASLDHPEHVTPLDHIDPSPRIPWVRLADGLPTFPDDRVESGKP